MGSYSISRISPVKTFSPFLALIPQEDASSDIFFLKIPAIPLS